MEGIIGIITATLMIVWILLMIIYAWAIERFKERHPQCPRCKGRGTKAIKGTDLFHCEDCHLNFGKDEKR